MRHYKHTAMGAALGVLLGLAACEGELAPPFEPEGSGTLTGRVFLDVNRNGTFEPLAGDRALEGVELVVLDRGTTQILAGATTRTDAQGQFQIANLPLGTHDLLVSPSSIPEGVAICQNPVPASIFRNETQFQPVAGRAGCVVTIVEAEAEPLGSFVTVSGIVTSRPGMIRGGYTHIEDASGGIRLFETGLEGRDIEVGDRIEVSGTLAQFGGDLQLTGVTLNALEKDAANPQPELVSTGQIAAAGLDPLHELLGRYVRVKAARLVGAFGSGGLHFRNAPIDTGDGQAQIRLESSVAADEAAIAALMTVGRCYDVVGVLGSFNQDGQLFPRLPGDVVEVPCP